MMRRRIIVDSDSDEYKNEEEEVLEVAPTVAERATNDGSTMTAAGPNGLVVAVSGINSSSQRSETSGSSLTQSFAPGCTRGSSIQQATTNANCAASNMEEDNISSMWKESDPIIELGGSKFRVLSLACRHFGLEGTGFREFNLVHPTNVGMQLRSPFFKGHAKSSPWWIFFNIGNKAYCNLCGTGIGVGKDNSPTNLKKHIDRRHKEVYKICVSAWSKSPKSTKTQQAITSFATNTLRSGDEKRARVVRAITRFVIANNIPFSVVKNAEFRRLLRVVREDGRTDEKGIVGIDAVMDDITFFTLDLTAILKESLLGCVVHGTTDHWSDRANRSWESKSKQFINENFQLQSCDIELKEVSTSDTKAENLFDSYVADSETWGISFRGIDRTKKVYIIGPNEIHEASCVTDTESKMNKFGTMMYDKHRLDHMYCTDHLLQATASIPFKFKFFVGDEMDPSEQGDKTTTTMVNAGGQQVTMNLGKGLLAQCCKLVCSFSHSNLKTKALKQAQLALSSTNTKYGNKDNQLNVVIDVVTRWWSTYDMIERLLFLQEALEYMT